MLSPSLAPPSLAPLKLSSPASSTIQSDQHSQGVSISTALTTPDSYKYFGLDGTNDDSTVEIVQVNLKGATIREAWERNRTIVDREFGATLADQERKFGPPHTWAAETSTTSLNVYHGTTVHMESEAGLGWAQTWTEPIHTIQARANAAQMNPRTISVVYTAYSPLRAFLWAYIRGGVYKNLPSSMQATEMSKSWVVRGKTFEGVAVFAYANRADATITTAKIPLGEEAAWMHGCQSVNDAYLGDNPAQKAWMHPAPTKIHRSPLQSWPDILYGSEFGSQKQHLERFGINMVRAVFLEGKGVEHLRKGYKGTYAISWEYEAPALAPPAIGHGAKKHGKDEDGDKKCGGLRKKLSQMLGRKNKET